MPIHAGPCDVGSAQARIRELEARNALLEEKEKNARLEAKMNELHASAEQRGRRAAEARNTRAEATTCQ